MKNTKVTIHLGGLLIVALFFSGCGASDVETVQVVEDAPVDEVVYQEIGDTFDLPILLYHHVDDAPVGARSDITDWYVSPEKFEEDLQYLSEQGYEPLFMREVLQYIEEGRFPEKSMVLSFDDGAKDFLTTAFPILKKYNMKSSVSLMTGVRGAGWLSDEDIKTLHDSGLVEFVSHTQYHEYLSRVSEDQIREELLGSKKKIEEWTGESMVVIAYPFGLYSDSVIEIAKDVGYQVGMTIKAGNTQSKDDLFEMKRHIITEWKDIRNIL